MAAILQRRCSSNILVGVPICCLASILLFRTSTTFAETTVSSRSSLRARQLSFAGHNSLANTKRPVFHADDALVGRKAEGEVSKAKGAESWALESALFLAYFGLQSGMSLYMKWILSKVEVVKGVLGVPASFFVTATQQLVGLGLFILLMIGSRLIGKPYRPKPLTQGDILLVLALSLSFSFNIGCNLLSLSLVPLSLSMIIRACSPVTTALMQSVMVKKSQDIAPKEWACMSFGVICAIAVALAQSPGMSGQASFAFFFGVFVSFLSLLSAGLDFVFKGILGNQIKLNAIDTTCYVSLPIAMWTGLMGLVASKPVSTSWATYFNTATMTDWEVYSKVWQVNPGVFAWVLASGLLAFVYNTFVTFIVVKLSPATTAFAGNFNKAATILLSLFLLEGKLPAGIRAYVTTGGVIANIVAFTLYNVLKSNRKKAQK